MLVSLFIVSLIIFTLTQALPGSAATISLGQFGTEERVAELEQEMGLDQPIYIQYIDWITGFLTGDWGNSLIYGTPIFDLVVPRLIRSAQLALFSLITVALISIPLGVFTAIKKDSPIDPIISSATYVGNSLPEFVTGTLLILVFAGPVFSVFPSSGYVPPTEGIIPWLRHLALPVITLTIILIAHVLRQTRGEMIETLQSEYIRSARLKGLSERDVIFNHALRNGLLPAITVLALQLGWMLGGIVIVEEVFAYPGIGRLVVEAIKNRDIPLIQVTVLIVASAYMISNMIADILYTYVDPRIEYGD